MSQYRKCLKWIGNRDQNQSNLDSINWIVLREWSLQNSQTPSAFPDIGSCLTRNRWYVLHVARSRTFSYHICPTSYSCHFLDYCRLSCFVTLSTIPVAVHSWLPDCTSPTRSLTGAVRLNARMSTCACPSNTALNLRNKCPWSSFVKKSASMARVGQSRMVVFASFDRSLIQKYRKLMCRDRGPEKCIHLSRA